VSPVKFVTLIPRTYNDGQPIKMAVLNRLIRELYDPFGGMTREEGIRGYWRDTDGTEYSDETVRISRSNANGTGFRKR
jgi:hypothetical protein